MAAAFAEHIRRRHGDKGSFIEGGAVFCREYNFVGVFLPCFFPESPVGVYAAVAVASAVAFEKVMRRFWKKTAKESVLSDESLSDYT